MEPAKAEPAKAEPAKAEPAKAEPAKSPIAAAGAPSEIAEARSTAAMEELVARRPGARHGLVLQLGAGAPPSPAELLALHRAVAIVLGAPPPAPDRLAATGGRLKGWLYAVHRTDGGLYTTLLSFIDPSLYAVNG